MSNVTPLAAADFDQEVLQSATPVLVDFYATWCGPCKMIAPVLDGLAQTYDGKVKFVKINVEEAYDLASRYNVSGVPTLLIFKGGEVVDQIVGFVPAQTLSAKLGKVVG